MHTMVTGGTGFVGRHLVARLDSPLVLGRNPQRAQFLAGNVVFHTWDHASLLDPDVFAGVDTVFHLAGESVFKGRWNRRKKERILRSRVEGTRWLVRSMERLATPPATLICASAIGYYGSRGKIPLTESSPPGTDFLAQVCLAWEKEAGKAEELGTRVVRVRTGIVLGRDGGALPQMLTPFRLGVGGRIGSGRQHMSWIHIDDLTGIMLQAAANNSIRGPVNAVAPSPVTNREFTAALAAALHRPAFFHVPGWALRITLGEFADVLLSSQHVLADKITNAGYCFKYSSLPAALDELVP